MKLNQDYKIKNLNKLGNTNLFNPNKNRRVSQLNIITQDFLSITDKEEIIDTL